MIRRRARFFADRRHRPADREAHDVLEGDHPAVDDWQAGGDATGFDLLAVISAQSRATRIVENKATTTDREMAAFGAECAGNIFVVIPQRRIVGFVHRRISMTGAADRFRSL